MQTLLCGCAHSIDHSAAVAASQAAGCAVAALIALCVSCVSSLDVQCFILMQETTCLQLEAGVCRFKEAQHLLDGQGCLQAEYLLKLGHGCLVPEHGTALSNGSGG